MTTDLEQCREVIAHHSKSFSLAARLLPRDSRDPIAVLYAWCRRADDAIDLAVGEEQARALEHLERELDAIYAGQAQSDPILAEFQKVVEAAEIPESTPRSLLAGMRMDAEGHAYETWDDLILYAYRVASTVGLMSCRIMGVSSNAALSHATDLGLAMQLSNVARDVQEDWQRGRLYLPKDLLERHGAGELWNAWRSGSPELPRATQEACRGALRELLERADEHYRSAELGLRYLRPRAAVAVAVALEVYSAIGTVIAEQGHDVFAPRAFVPTWRKLWLALRATTRALFRRIFPLPRTRPLLRSAQ